MADDENQVPAGELPAEESLGEETPGDETTDENRTDEVPSGEPPVEASADAPADSAAPRPPKTPWVAVGVGVVALLTILLVALSYALPAPRATVPTAWTASPSASVRTSKVTVSATPRPSSAAPTTLATDAPTGFPTSTRCGAGQVIMGAAWTAVVPTGWSCAGGPATVGTTSFQSATGDVISVGLSTAKDAVTACSSPFGDQAATVERFPDTTWGGRKAVTVNAQFPAMVVHYRCVQTSSGVYLMGGVVRSSADALIAGMDGLTASWVWA